MCCLEQKLSFFLCCLDGTQSFGLSEDAVHVSGFGRGSAGIQELGVMPQVVAVL
jgi:hypothetical protein